MRMDGRMATRVAVLAAGLLLAMAPASFAAPEGFETVNGLNGWTADGLWHLKQNPQNTSVISGINPELVTLPDSGALLPAASGSHVVWFGQDSTGTYCLGWVPDPPQSPKNGCSSSDNVGGELTSPILAGPASGAQITFDAWYEVEAVDPFGHDAISVEYTNDVTPTGLIGTINPVGAGGNPDQSYSNVGLEQTPVWKHYVVDIPAAAFSAASPHIKFH